MSLSVSCIRSLNSLVSLLIVTILSNVWIIYGESVKFYFNNCVGDLYLHDYHNYTGITLTSPPNITLFESGIFEYEYATHEEFHSLLDGNVNWRSKYETKANLVHLFFNVNTTGGIYVDVEDHHTLGAVGCSDVIDNNGQIPTIIGIYSYWRSNTTYDTCKSKTNNIDGCQHQFYIQ